MNVIDRLRIEANQEPHEPIWTDAIAEIQSLQTTLSMVADIAHSGVLFNLDNESSMVAIRQLTRDVWNALGTIEDHKNRVFAARLRSMRPLN